MTTTNPRLDTIRYAIQAGNLLTQGTPTGAALDRLAQMTAEALAAAFPGASVECPIERTSGVRPAGYTRLTGPARDDYDVHERITYVADSTWERWCRDLADADVES